MEGREFDYRETIKTITGRDGLCAICYQNYSSSENVQLMKACNHVFHKDCIDAWFQTNRNCPLCSTPLHEDFKSLEEKRAEIMRFGFQETNSTAESAQRRARASLRATKMLVKTAGKAIDDMLDIVESGSSSSPPPGPAGLFNETSPFSSCGNGPLAPESHSHFCSNCYSNSPSSSPPSAKCSEQMFSISPPSAECPEQIFASSSPSSEPEMELSETSLRSSLSPESRISLSSSSCSPPSSEPDMELFETSPPRSFLREESPEIPDILLSSTSIGRPEQSSSSCSPPSSEPDISESLEESSLSDCPSSEIEMTYISDQLEECSLSALQSSQPKIIHIIENYEENSSSALPSSKPEVTYILENSEEISSSALPSSKPEVTYILENSEEISSSALPSSEPEVTYISENLKESSSSALSSSKPEVMCRIENLDIQTYIIEKKKRKLR